jgi:hypothetical protein
MRSEGFVLSALIKPLAGISNDTGQSHYRIWSIQPDPGHPSRPPRRECTSPRTPDRELVPVPKYGSEPILESGDHLFIDLSEEQQRQVVGTLPYPACRRKMLPYLTDSVRDQLADAAGDL